MTTSVESKIAAGKACKDKGNAAFSLGNFTEALWSYHEAILYLKGLDTESLQGIVPGKSLEKEWAQALKACHNNMAACYLKLGKFDKALSASDKVLSIDNKDAKAYFRRGQAHSSLGNYEKAQKDFLKAAGLSPQDKGIRAELDAVNQKLKEAAAKSDAKMRENLSKAMT